MDAALPNEWKKERDKKVLKDDKNLSESDEIKEDVPLLGDNFELPTN